jgi:hypothetical protein
MATTIGRPPGARLLMAALGCGAFGCGGGAISSPGGGEMICTSSGCNDQFSATVTMDATQVPAGTHTVNVVADGAATSCTFPFPPTDAVAQCSSGLTVIVQAAAICTTVQTDAAITEKCQPIDGKFTESIWVSGTPSVVQVQQLVAGTVILDQTIAPTYQTNQPNGPGCGPTCHRAGAAWTIP